MFRRYLLIFVFFCVYLTLFYHIGTLAFLGADEPRYARVAEEMNLRRNYVTPTLNFRPWLEKPPLLFWMEAASFRLLGISERSARLPVALLALAATAFCTAFPIQKGGGEAGFCSALILLTSPFFFLYARAAGTDMPLTACLTAALALSYIRPHGITWGAAAGVALGLAVLAKGPIALFLFGGIGLGFFLATGCLRWNLKWLAGCLGAFLVVAVPWFWLVWKENGYDFLSTFVINHHLARFFTDIHHHAQPFWYFVPVLLLGMIPWTPFFWAPLVRLWQARKSWCRALWHEEVWLWLWVLVPFLFFSASRSKLPGYVLPSVPPLAILAGKEWARYFSGQADVRQASRTFWVAFLLGILACLLLVIGFAVAYDSASTGLILSLPFGIGMAWAFLEWRKKHIREVFLVTVASLSLLAALLAAVAAPLLGDYHSARDLCRLASAGISRKEPLILYRYFHHTALYYTGYRTTPEAIPGLEALRAYAVAHPQSQYLLLTQAAGWDDLRRLKPTLISKQGNLFLMKIQKEDLGPEGFSGRESP
ncbi:MAG: glycosyltransferase family 39 protein [Acidobacteria bacterium]|nr:glycosyltransferase family 39 protein [Acidobacteriota bacterium]